MVVCCLVGSLVLPIVAIGGSIGQERNCAALCCLQVNHRGFPSHDNGHLGVGVAARGLAHHWHQMLCKQCIAMKVGFRLSLGKIIWPPLDIAKKAFFIGSLME